MINPTENYREFNQCINAVNQKWEWHDLQISVRRGGPKTLFLSTPVYEGINYIPPSVRDFIHKEHQFELEEANIFLTIDEEKYQIQLHCMKEGVSPSAVGQLQQLLNAFGEIAQEWKYFLREEGNKDLIQVRVH